MGGGGERQGIRADGVLRKQWLGAWNLGPAVGSSGGRGVTLLGGEAEQMGWGHMDFALNTDFFLNLITIEESVAEESNFRF